MSVANNFCDMPLPKYLDLKTVLIYCPHPVFQENLTNFGTKDTIFLRSFQLANQALKIRSLENTVKVQNRIIWILFDFIRHQFFHSK